MRCPSLYVITALVWSGLGPLFAQRDPFAPPGNATGGEDSAPAQNFIVQIRLDIDSIEIPHDQANALNRSMGGAFAGGSKARETALLSVAAGQGKRLHRQFLTTPLGRSQSESIQESPCPTEFDPVMLGLITNPGPPEVVKPFYTPTTPQSFEFKHLGWTTSAEVSCDPSSGWVELNLSHSWSSLTAEHAWSRDYAEIKQPIFHHCQFDSRFPLRRGEWTLATLLRRPNPEAEGVGGPFVPDRVLTFIRALWEDPAAPVTNASRPAKAKAAKTPPAAGLLHEWIEISQTDAAALLARYPAGEQSGALRNDLQERISKGQASLLETTYQILRSAQKSNTRSVTEIGNAANFAPAQGGGQTQGTIPPAIQKYERLFFGDTPRIPETFQLVRTGIDVETELTCVRNEGPFSINTQARMVRLMGIRCHGDGTQEKQRLETVECPAGFAGSLIARQPCLIAKVDAPPPASLGLLRGPSVEKIPEKALLVFVTVLP